MKKIILFILALIPMLSWAQTDKKYIDPLPMEDGRITFKTQLKAPTLSQEEIYEAVYRWANSRFTPNEKMNPRIVYTNVPNGTIVVTGEEYIVFSSSMLSVDRSRIYYQLQLDCKPESVNIQMSKIKYWYEEMRDGGQKYKAEEWITDKLAVNKAKTKLLPMTGKFRRETIDLRDELIKQIQDKIGALIVAKTPTNNVPRVTVAASNGTNVETAPTTPTPAVQPQQPAATVNSVGATPSKAYASNDEIVAAANRITVTSGNDEQFKIGKESWGGFGKLFGKDVAFCLIETQKIMANMLLAQNDNYTISFYIPGKADAALVVKCKKMSAQQINGEEANKMNSKNDASKKYNMYVGEIVK